MKYISYNWTLALKIFNWKEKENARLPNTYGARLYIAHTDSQLCFDKYKICVQNKCALCTLYTVVCTYSIHIAIV